MDRFILEDVTAGILADVYGSTTTARARNVELVLAAQLYPAASINIRKNARRRHTD